MELKIKLSLKGKRILITAGPTWVAIDSIRVIGNISTGTTGALCAKKLSARGAKVTLLLGPCGKHSLSNSIRLINFRFFNELKDILKRKLKKNKYDIIIHSAAVSDFYPVRKKSSKEKRFSNGVKPESTIKLKSDKTYNLRLVPLEKLIFLIRRLSQGAKLVMFKLESAVVAKTLINRAKSAGKEVRADLIVANQLNPYRAYIIEGDKQIIAKSKKELVKKLIKILVDT